MLKKHNNIYEISYKTHRYPVSWRSKKPVYVMCTDQIILNITESDINNAKQTAEKSNWYGSEGLQTFLQTLNNRDCKWCISRQRKWGTPCMLFYNKTTNQIVNNTKANNLILELIKQHGEDFWFEKQYTDSIIKSCFENNSNILTVNDTLDVWFDSGCSLLTLENKPDIICEGRDQHRGWFQTICLVNSLLAINKFPKNIIVHGFVNFKQDVKISKSNKLTHTISEQIMSVSGEIIRLVIHSSNCGKDVIFNETTIEQAEKLHLKIYNILRYYVNIKQYHHCDAVINNLLNVSIVNKAKQETEKYYENMKEYGFQNAFKNICNIINILSECIRINRNTIYCGNPTQNNYQQAITCIAHITKLLCKLCYPVIPATVFYILNNINALTDETKIIKYLQNNNIQTVKYSSDQRLFEIINEIFNKLNNTIEVLKQQNNVYNIKQTQEIGLLLNTKYSHIYEYVKQYCEVSFVSNHNEKHKYTHLVISDFNIENTQVTVINIKTQFYKCERCWRYFETLTNNMCNTCCLNIVIEKQYKS